MSTAGRRPEDLLPLTAATFHILLALAGPAMHGYAIMQEIGERAEIKLGPATLYTSLKRLVDEGLVSERAAPASVKDADARRRYYVLTEFGRAVARAEARRLEGTVREARRRRLIGPAR